MNPFLVIVLVPIVLIALGGGWGYRAGDHSTYPDFRAPPASASSA